MLGKDPQNGLKGINHQETAEQRARFLMFCLSPKESHEHFQLQYMHPNHHTVDTPD